MKNTIEFKNTRRGILTEEKCRDVKRGKKIRFLNDEKGLFLFIPPLGREKWFIRCLETKDRGKSEIWIPLGYYFDIDLEEARKRCDFAYQHVMEYPEEFNTPGDIYRLLKQEYDVSYE